MTDSTPREAVRLYEFLHHLPGCAAGYLWGTEPADQCDCGLFDAIRVVGLNARAVRLLRDILHAQNDGEMERAMKAAREWMKTQPVVAGLNASESPPPDDVERLGLSAEQTRNLRQHLTSRQQTLGEWIGDVLFDYRMGRPDGIDYPPAMTARIGDASESPPHNHDGGEPCFTSKCPAARIGDASESPPPDHTHHHGIGVYANLRDTCPACRDASESGQPPEADRG